MIDPDGEEDRNLYAFSVLYALGAGILALRVAMVSAKLLFFSLFVEKTTGLFRFLKDSIALLYSR